MGLRELKKEQTRLLIADTAGRLFAERGFGDASVAHREPGISALAAVRTCTHATTGLLYKIELGDADALDRLRTVNRVIADIPAPHARDRRAKARCTGALASQLLDECGAHYDEVTAHVVANALIGAHQALLAMVRRRTLADDRPEALATDVEPPSPARSPYSSRAWPVTSCQTQAVKHNPIHLIHMSDPATTKVCLGLRPCPDFGD